MEIKEGPIIPEGFPDPMQFFNTGTQEQSMTDMMGLLFDGKDISLKTEIKNPQAMSTLEVFSQRMYDVGFYEASKYLSDKIDRYKIDMVSKGRGSREEFVDLGKGVQMSMQPQVNIGENLTENLGK